MVNVDRAGRRAPRRAAPGAAYDVRIGRVVLDGVPAVGHDELAAAIEESLLQALTAGAALPPSRHVAVAAGDAVTHEGPSFADRIAGAMAPVVLDAPSRGAGS